MNKGRCYPSSFLHNNLLYVFGGDSDAIEQLDTSNFAANKFKLLNIEVPTALVEKCSPAIIPNFLNTDTVLILGASKTTDAYVFKVDKNEFERNSKIQLYHEDWFHQTIKY